MSRRGALLLMGLGTLLIASTGAAACQARPAGDFVAPVPAVSPAPVPAGPVVPVNDGRPPSKAAADAPTRLSIPAVKITAPVDAVGIDDATGDFAVPGAGRAGWYRFGPGLTATAGSIVVAGHVDSTIEDRGVFFRLDDVEAGDEVVLTGADGRTRTFRVTARERHRKTAIPLAKYFARDGAARLTLITCGGPFDRKTRHYRDNVVVTAVPTA